MGDNASAGDHLGEVLKRDPGFTIARSLLPTLHYKREGDLAHHRESLLLAGMRA